MLTNILSILNKILLLLKFLINMLFNKLHYIYLNLKLNVMVVESSVRIEDSPLNWQILNGCDILT